MTSVSSLSPRHEVVITWSLSSGKQAIAFDRHEVFFDVGDTTQTKLSHAWRDAYGHTLEVRAHAASMSTKMNPDPHWRQYDLLVDGVSYFRMPKIFQIGVFEQGGGDDSYKLRPKLTQYPSSRVSPTNNMPADEPKPVEVVDLLSFDDLDGPAPAPAAQAGYQPAQVPATTNYTPPQAPPAQTSYQPAQLQQQNYAPPTNPFTSSQAQSQGALNYVSPNTSPVESGYSNALVPAQPANSNTTRPVMNTFNPAPVYQQQQGMYNNGYAPQQQPQYNNYNYQSYVQPGVGHQ